MFTGMVRIFAITASFIVSSESKRSGLKMNREIDTVKKIFKYIGKSKDEMDFMFRDHFWKLSHGIPSGIIYNYIHEKQDQRSTGQLSVT